MNFKLLDEIVDEMLSIDKPAEIRQSIFRDRIHNILNRGDINKQLRDEREFENDKVLKAGKQAQDFLNSSYYNDLIKPMFKQDIKGGIQRLVREHENMTESQIRGELTTIHRAIVKIAALRLKIINAENLKRQMATQMTKEV